MRRINVRDLIAQPMIEIHVFHESGEVLCSSSTGFGPENIEVFERAGIETVYLLDGYDNVVEFSLDRRKKFILTEELRPEHDLVGPFVGNDEKMLVTFGEPIDSDLRTRLKRHGYYSVCVRKTNAELRLDQVTTFRRASRKLRRTRLRNSPLPPVAST